MGLFYIEYPDIIRQLEEVKAPASKITQARQWRDQVSRELTAKTTQPKAVKANDTWTKSKRIDRNSPEKSKESHFKDHQKEFKGAYKNSQEYHNAAKKLLNNPPKGTLTKMSSNGDVKRFNPNTGEFVAMNKNGNIKTYFKPNTEVHGYKTNKEYFYESP